jgi:hypothetical protein
VAKIKPVIEDLMQRHNLVAELDPHNEGVLIVHLNGGQPPSGNRGLNPGDIVQRLENNQDCAIM